MTHRLMLLATLLPLLCYSQQAMAQQEGAPAGQQVELFCGANLGYADTNWLRLYDLQINATPGVRWNLGHDWSVAAQGLIPVVSEGYTYRDIINKYWRVNMAVISRQQHFTKANQHLKLSIGLFSLQHYGADVKWAWPVNDWLLLNAQAGLTSSWIMGTDFKGNTDVDFYGNFRFTGSVGADVYMHSHQIEFRLSGGRYAGGDYGSQLDVMRHFRHCTLLAYAQLRLGQLTANTFDNKKYRTNGGFKIIWMLPPYKKSSQKVSIRLASNFRLTHNMRAEWQAMQSYAIDPEENEREHQVDVSWGLRKEVQP